MTVEPLRVVHVRTLLAAFVVLLGGCVDERGDVQSDPASRAPGRTQTTEGTPQTTRAEVAPVEVYNRTLHFASPGGSGNPTDSFLIPPQPALVELRWVEQRDCPVGYARGQSFIVEDEGGKAHTFHPVGTSSGGGMFSWECVNGPATFVHGPEALAPTGGKWAIRLYGECMCAVEIAVIVTPSA